MESMARTLEPMPCLAPPQLPPERRLWDLAGGPIWQDQLEMSYSSSSEDTQEAPRSLARLIILPCHLWQHRQRLCSP